MAAVRQRGTAPELLVRQVASAIGLRYRVNCRSVPGSPDLVNKTQGFAIFVHGCFWHRHKGCSKATTPSRNREFWLEKFAANRTRDAKKIKELERLGLTVLVIWECEVMNTIVVTRKLGKLARMSSIGHAARFGIAARYA